MEVYLIAIIYNKKIGFRRKIKNKETQIKFVYCVAVFDECGEAEIFTVSDTLHE